MVVHEVVLGVDDGERALLVAAAQGCRRALGEHAHELQFHGDVILADGPRLGFLQAAGTVDGQHLVAGVLHEQALLGGVHALEGVGRRVGVDARAQEGAGVVHGELHERVDPGVGEVLGDLVVARIHERVARGHRVVGLHQLGEQPLVHLVAEQAGDQLVGGRAALAQRRQVGSEIVRLSHGFTPRSASQGTHGRTRWQTTGPSTPRRRRAPACR